MAAHMCRTMLVGLVIVGCSSLAACGSDSATSPPPTTLAEATTSQPALPLNDAGLATCTAGGGPTTGQRGLGGGVADFAAAHAPQHPGASSQYGRAGLTWTVSCSRSDAVIFIQEDHDFAVPAANLKAAGYFSGNAVIPADSTIVSDDVESSCELLHYHSDSLANDVVAGKPDGNFIAELSSPASSGAHYHPDAVNQVIFDASATGSSSTSC